MEFMRDTSRDLSRTINFIPIGWILACTRKVYVTIRIFLHFINLIQRLWMRNKNPDIKFNKISLKFIIFFFGIDIYIYFLDW